MGRPGMTPEENAWLDAYARHRDALWAEGRPRNQATAQEAEDRAIAELGPFPDRVR